MILPFMAILHETKARKFRIAHLCHQAIFHKKEEDFLGFFSFQIKKEETMKEGTLSKSIL